MRKVLYIARREFMATVLTKSFIYGVLLTPALLGLMVFVMPRLIMKAPPKMAGRVEIIDPTGAVADGLSAYLTPERFAERRAREKEEIEQATPSVMRRQTDPRVSAAVRQSLDSVLGEVPRIDVVPLPAGADVERAKEPLLVPTPKGGPEPATLLALVVVHPDAVRQQEGEADFGTYDLFVRSKLDDRLVNDIHRGMAESIVAARLEASGVDRTRARGLTEVPRPSSVTVTMEGEQKTSRVLNEVIPLAFVMLLSMSVLTSGSYLLMSTIEEKASRVVEVLLSGASAMELMTGKILGQMAVGVVLLALYAALGLLALVSFASIGMIDPMLLPFLIIFYVLAYFMTAAMIAAVGSAVNDIREAQSLNMPVMLVLMIPLFVWLPITQQPNSVLAVALSFIPPMSNFVVLLRMTSAAPPPAWQVSMSILIGAAGVYAAFWFAAKVFRVGLLMFGKPPSFGTLVRWARMS
jgi:ABC-2 type transport system permease protein